MKKIFLCITLILSCTFIFSQKYDAEVIDQNTHIEINRDKLTKTIYYKIKINNRDGDEYSKISISFSKLYKVSNIKAHIEDTEGQVIKKLKKSEIKEKSNISDISLFEDSYIKQFVLKHNSYPYIII